MKAIYIAKKIVSKAVAFLSFSLLSVFKFVFIIFSAIYRFLSIPLSAMGVFLAGYELFTGKLPVFTAVYLILVFTAIFAARFLLPHITSALNRIITSLKEYILAPIIVTSPVRYTL